MNDETAPPPLKKDSRKDGVGMGAGAHGGWNNTDDVIGDPMFGVGFKAMLLIENGWS